jgi:hypothetical protein
VLDIKDFSNIKLASRFTVMQEVDVLKIHPFVNVLYAVDKMYSVLCIEFSDLYKKSVQYPVILTAAIRVPVKTWSYGLEITKNGNQIIVSSRS